MIFIPTFAGMTPTLCFGVQVSIWVIVGGILLISIGAGVSVCLGTDLSAGIAAGDGIITHGIILIILGGIITPRGITTLGTGTPTFITDQTI